MLKPKTKTAFAPVLEFDEKKIDQVFGDVDQCQKPGVAVGIAVNGRAVYRKGFGLATMELPLVLTPATRMRIYSVSKHFTCLSYMLLCEDGKAGLDDPLGRYFPEFHPSTHKVTLRQLMGNVNGLRDAHGLNFQFCGTQWLAPSSEIIKLYCATGDMDAAPGTNSIYNNGGFHLVANAIERISGQDLGEFMRQRIFEPIGMVDTLLRRTDSDFVPNSATMHPAAPNGGFVRAILGGDRSGTGGIASTVNDMLRWLARMDDPKVGSRETWALMKTPQTLANGTTTGYGFGLALDTYRGLETIYHTGGGMGANAQILKVPSLGIDITMMANRDDASCRQLTLKVLDACVTGLGDAPQPVAGPFAAGLFRSPASGRVIQLYEENGKQFGLISGFTAMQLIPDEQGALRPLKAEGIPYKCAVTLVGDRAQPSALHYSEFGNEDDLQRLAPASKPDLSKVAGRYHCAAGFDATITESGMQTAGRFGAIEYNLESLGPGVWHAKIKNNAATFLTGIVTFDEPESNAGFRFWSYTTRALPFRRVG